MRKVNLLLMGAVALISAFFMQTSVAKAEETDYLTLTFEGTWTESGTHSISLYYESGKDVQYSYDGTTWYNLEGEHGGVINIYADKPQVQFRGTDVITSGNSERHFYLNGLPMKASGSVTSLVDGNGSNPDVKLFEGQFCGLFSGCTKLQTAPKLPATTLAKECYKGMFSACYKLKEAPKLPATTLAEGCYKSMFADCYALKQAPELKATTLAKGCYGAMFSNCSALEKAPELKATTLAEECYFLMFNNCALETAPELEAENMETRCYESMFTGCTSLKEAPKLEATTLAVFCYASMFEGCTSLKEAPKLEATTLAGGCYQNMFKGCTALETAPDLPATTLAVSCYASMFDNCTDLEEAPKLEATTLAEGCYMNMFSGCTKLKTAPKLENENLETSCYESMFYGCTALETAPDLPATTLAEGCYTNMFSGCSKLGKLKVNFKDWNGAISATDGILENAGTELESGTKGVIYGPESLKNGSLPKGWEVKSISITKQPENAQVFEGEKATLSVEATSDAGDQLYYQWYRNPGNGYVKITGANAGTYEVASATLDDNKITYMCEMVSDNNYPVMSEAATIVVKEKKEDPKPIDPTKRFTDVQAGKWYSKPNGPIAYVLENKIMSGTGDGSTFEPDGKCTREMFVQILYNSEGKPGAGPTNPFTDVKSGKWYYNAVTWALANKVTGGKSTTSFGLGENVTREQLAQFLMNYAKKRGFDTSAKADLSKYPDSVEISGWATDAVSWANANGIINGKAKDGVKFLAPKDNATRAETAQMIMSFQEKFGKN